MNDFTTTSKPSKLIPALIGGGAMVAISVIPILNIVNCACCAGIMGAAVLGVWFYKKSFPGDMAFTVGDGAGIGALSGLVAAPVATIAQLLTLGIFSAESTINLQDKFDEAFSQAESQATDPAAVEAVREMFMGLAASPAMLFVVALLFALIIYVGFGALGGVIGGNIFKTKILPPQQMPPMENQGGF
jgi:pheromone shutdown protein TraB